MIDEERAREETLLERGNSVLVALPPSAGYVVDLSLKEPKPLPKERPDLALSEADVDFAKEGGHLIIVVHNVGLAPAEKVTVRVTDGRTGETMGEETIPLIEAPLDLEPRLVRLYFDTVDTAPSRSLKISIDPDNEIDEIDESNNEMEVVF